MPGVGSALVESIPELLLMLVGLVLAIVTWRRLGRAALTALVGFAVLALAALISLVNASLLVSFGPLRLGRALSSDTNLALYGVSFVVHLILTVAGWVFILLALFRRRPARPIPGGPAQPAADSPGQPAPGGPMQAATDGPTLGQFPPRAAASGPGPMDPGRRSGPDEKSPFGGPGGDPTWHQLPR